MNMKQDPPWDMTRHAPMPRPDNDDGYFENMSKAVFLAGLNWRVIEKKWPDIKRLFADFSINSVAQFNDGDIDRLLKDDGSFVGLIVASPTSEDTLLKDLHKRFAFLGESTAMIFLFSVGEEMPETLKKMQAAHGSR